LKSKYAKVIGVGKNFRKFKPKYACINAEVLAEFSKNIKGKNDSISCASEYYKQIYSTSHIETSEISNLNRTKTLSLITNIEFCFH
jgi:hypothetical protein